MVFGYKVSIFLTRNFRFAIWERDLHCLQCSPSIYRLLHSALIEDLLQLFLWGLVFYAFLLSPSLGCWNFPSSHCWTSNALHAMALLDMRLRLGNNPCCSNRHMVELDSPVISLSSFCLIFLFSSGFTWILLCLFAFRFQVKHRLAGIKNIFKFCPFLI